MPDTTPKSNVKVNFIGKGETHVSIKSASADKPYHEESEQFHVNSGIEAMADPAYVKVALGLTINLGNFESARVDVSLEMPTNPAIIDEIHSNTVSWVDERLTALAGKIKNQHGV